MREKITTNLLLILIILGTLIVAITGLFFLTQNSTEATVVVQEDTGISPIDGDIKYGKYGLYIDAINPGSGIYEILFHPGVIIQCIELGNATNYKFEIDSSKLVDKDGTQNSPIISGTSYVQIRKVMIAPDSFNEFVGSSGTIKVVNRAGDTLGTFTTNTPLNSNGDYEISIPATTYTKEDGITLITSQPTASDKKLNAYFETVIDAKLPYTLEQVQNLSKLTQHSKLYTSSDSEQTWEYDPEKDLSWDFEFMDSQTSATLQVLTSSLKAGVKKQELKVKVLLNNGGNHTDTDAWGNNPCLDIVLPEYVTNIDQQFGLSIASYNSDIQHDSAVIYAIDGKIHFFLQLKGNQTFFTTNDYYVELTFKVDVDKWANNCSKNIECYYINPCKYQYKASDKSVWPITPTNTQAQIGSGVYAENTECGKTTGAINFTTDAKLLCVQELSNYKSNGGSINSLDNPNSTDSIDRTGVQNAKTNLIIQNNCTSAVSNVKILGRIPYTGNKSAISEQNLGTNINTELASAITKKGLSLGSMGNYTVYYSTNANATNDESLNTNNWTTEAPADWSTIRSYLIVIDGTLDPGERAEFEYNFNIPNNLNYGQSLFSNFGAYYTEGSTNKTSETDKIGLTTGDGPELRLQKSSSVSQGSTVKEGDIITYTLTVYNDSTSKTAHNVKITDNIPEHTVLVEEQADGTYIEKPNESQIVFEIGTLQPSASQTKTFKVKVKEITANTVISNVAGVTADGIANIPSNTSEINAVESSPNLEITKTSNINPGAYVIEGDEIIYTITVRNTGDGIARNVVIHDIIPDHTTYYDERTGQYDSTVHDIQSEPIETLGPGESKTFSFKVRVEEITEDTIIRNAATATADNGNSGSSNSVDISAKNKEPKLVLEKTSNIPNGATVKEGDKIKYTLTVRNDGYGPATNVIVTDKIPENTTYINEAGEREPKEEIQFEPFDLPAQSSKQLSFTVIVDRVDDGTTIVNTAKVKGDNAPEQESNTVGIPASSTVPDLQVTKTSDVEEGETVKEGDIITYEVNVKNVGETPAYDVTISDTIPQYTTLVEKNSSGEWERKSQRDIEKTQSILNPGETFTLKFSVIVDEIPQETTIQNTAKVNADHSPEIPTNTVGIPAEASTPTLRAEKTSSVREGSIIQTGDTITYRITVYNEGNIAAHNVIISDTIPTNTIYYENGRQDTSKREVSKIIDTLEPGESDFLEFTVIVGELSANTTIQNTARISANNMPDINSNTLGISAKPKDTTSGEKIPYTGAYSFCIVLSIAIIGLSIFTVYQYKKIKRK